ncbi:MAG: N-acetyltransferase [Akkermansia sp.]|nr:N-acetyltransferase [Akkermansia sp.]
MKIRPVTPGDAPAIASIYNYYVQETVISFETEPLGMEEMRRRIGAIAAEYPYLVCVDAQGVVQGYACAHRWKERAAYRHTWEISIYLHPEKRGQGLGNLLMQELLLRCRAAGCRVLIACITEGNEASLAFHRKWGFRKVSHFPQVGCKGGRLLDVVDMCLLLQ